MNDELMTAKQELRRQMRKLRKAHALSLDESTRALIFMRPPGAVLASIPRDAIIGLYLDLPEEAPARPYARFFHESGHRIALPWFAGRDSLMEFREWRDPFGESDLEHGAWGAQPDSANDRLVPEVLFCPLVAFTEGGERMGQGGGHYDRWLEAHPASRTIGMAWDQQKVESLPLEPHDRPLSMIVTPTRLYGPFDA